LAAGVVAVTGHGLATTFFIQAGGRDSWLSGILAAPVVVIAVWAIARLSQIFPGKTIVEYLPQVLGPAGYLLAALYPLFWLATVVFTLRMTCDWLRDTILPETPSWVMGALYMLAVLYAASRGLDALARINQFLLPVLSLLGMFISTSTMQFKDYRLLLPLFENGPGPVLTATWLSLGYFGELSVATAFGASVRQRDRDRLFKAYLYAVLFLAVTLTGPLAGSISILGYRVAGNMPYPSFQHWLMVSFARFFERTDLLAVHQWLAGAYTRTAIFLLMAADCGTRLARVRKPPGWVMPCLGLLCVLPALWAFPTKPAFDWFVLNVYLPTSTVLGIVLPPVFLAVAYMRGLNRRGDQATAPDPSR
jgi:spore germination protein (amino acid permease)